MIIRNLDADGDWVFGEGKQCYLTGEAAIDLNIKTRLYSWVGDCFFALSAGIDWVNRLSSKNQKSLLDQEVNLVILKSYGVSGIISSGSTLNPSNRQYLANYIVNTIYSPVNGNVTIGNQNG